MASERLNLQTTSSQVSDELRMTPLARVAVVLPAVDYVVNLVIQRVDAGQWRTTGHELRVAFHDAQHGVQAPPLHTATLSPVASWWGWSWSPRSSLPASGSTAPRRRPGRSGTPPARSPAWGVGCWFVPIVNLWMPYGAVRDCLPPGHPERARVLRWWVAWLCTAYLSLLSSVFAFFSTGAALAVSIPAAARRTRRHRVGAGDRVGHRHGAPGRGEFAEPDLRRFLRLWSGRGGRTTADDGHRATSG